jgi:non-specific serine/threonine protein kinase
MGRLVFRQGDCERAAALFKESLALRKAHGDRGGIAACLTALAGVAIADGQPDQAARLFGAAEALRDAIHIPMPPAQRAEYDRQIAALQTSLNETALAAAWAEGRAMGPDQAIDYGLAWETSPRAAKSDGPAVSDRRVTILTSREREVAALIAQGLTNREIAARLVVAERTAEGHVQSILNKLGVNSRARIAVWAAEHGLRPGSGDG